MNLTPWPLAVGALALGLLGGVVLAFTSSRARGALSTARADLIARREALYAQLRELDDTRDKVDVELYKVEREKLLVAAAAVLRALDEPAPPGAAVPAAAKPPSRVSAAAWGIGAALVVLLLREGLATYATPRLEGQGLTGGMAPEAGPTIPPAAQAALEALRQKAAIEPPDVAAKNAYAHALIGSDGVMAAFKVTEEVIAIDPENAEARVHQAVVLLQIGDLVMATKMLDRVLTTAPDQAEALGYRGAIYAQAGQRAEAIAAWERAKSADPSQAAVFDVLILRVDSMAAGPGTGTGPGPQAEPAPSPVPPTGAPEFSGEVRLAPGVSATGTLFIYVRAAGVTSGPPLRVKKLPAEFPVKFVIHASDSPMGGSLPAGPVQLSARLDADGNAMTKDPSDPVARSAPVSVGAVDIGLELAPAP